jgi:predicted PurR-regulated permease PerM
MTESDSVDRPRPPAPPAAGFSSVHGLSDLALLALTALALLLCYLIARPFVSSLAWATALAVVGWPMHQRIARRVPRPSASAALSVTTIALLLIVPSALIIPGVIDEAFSGYRLVRAEIESRRSGSGCGNAWTSAT